MIHMQGQDTLTLLVDAHAEVGEGPVWDTARGVLWWVDITAGIVHRFEPHEGRDTPISVGAAVGAVALRRDGSLLLALADRLAVLDVDSGQVTDLLVIPGHRAPTRCNDGKCDAGGRFWVGRMAPDGAAGGGVLLRVDPDLGVTERFTGLAIPNGLGWSRDGRRMYFVDSMWHEVREFPYDPDMGAMGEGHPLVAFPDTDSLPDGLTVDADDCLWVARWNAGCVTRIGPDGTILGNIELPVSQVTSCTFGGEDLGDLYITTATEDFGPADFAREPLAGGLFRCRPGVLGLPAAPFAG